MPLFVSHRQLASRKSFPRAQGPWCEDSAGFTEIRLYGGYQTPPRQYVADVRLHMQEIGKMQWAAIQDWMCEPFMLAKTGLSVEEHQSRTIKITRAEGRLHHSILPGSKQTIQRLPIIHTKLPHTSISTC